MTAISPLPGVARVASDAPPLRDVSARSAIGTCDHCGGHAHSTLGGEHIWKCSEIVPEAAVQKFIDDLRHNSERRSYATFDADTADQIADELEELIDGRNGSQPADGE